jgi:PLP dependent protein
VFAFARHTPVGLLRRFGMFGAFRGVRNVRRCSGVSQGYLPFGAMPPTHCVVWPSLYILKAVNTQITSNLEAVRRRISAAAVRAGRDESEIKLVAVSKTHPPTAIEAAISAGAAFFGENKIQEAESKIAEIGRTVAEWHLIGHLQSNKVRRAVQIFDVIHTVDSIELARRLERICGEEGREALPILIEVDMAGEATKAGITERDLPGLIEFLKGCTHLQNSGLMVLPPFSEDPELTRPYFVRLRELRDRFASTGAFANGGDLSMGMSHDFEVAIEEGSTLVRVGTAIFGDREIA